MLIKDLKNCPEIIAGDKTILREILHPQRDVPLFRYSLAYAVLKPKQTSLRHRLKSCEVYYILKGKGRVHLNDEISEVWENQAIVIPPNTIQFIENTEKENLEFLCIVDPAWKIEDESVQ
jgi:mannose-6-phosphate isomerase-like protein (cupin superfamily)